MNPFKNIATPPDNIGGRALKPGDIVYHWRNPEIHFQIIGEPKWGKDGGELMILDDIAVCKPLIEGLENRKYSTFDLVKVEPTPEIEALAKQKTLDWVDSKFRRGMALHTDGQSRPCQVSPEQLGWDAAQAVSIVKKGYLEKAREEFGN